VETVSPLIADLAIVLCVAAATSVITRWLRQPLLLGYLLAGLLVGPHTPIPLFADESRVAALSELGVTLVMFCIGLEFSVRRLARLVPSAGIVCLIEVSTMLWLGYLAGQLLGYSPLASVFVGAIVAIPSTMVVIKVFDDQRIGGARAERVYGVLIVQDIVAVLLLAGLTALGTGRSVSAELLLPTLGRLAAFLIVLVLAGFLIVPRLVRALVAQHKPEVLVVASVGLCFAFALLAQMAGFSVALGAFLAGSLVAESGEPARVLRVVTPLRDVFAAVFFVSVGMSVEPGVIAQHWGAVLLLTGVVVIGQVASVGAGSFLAGAGVRGALQTGMSLVTIGEFSFLIAAVGIASGSIGRELLPITVAVAVLTTFITPFMVRAGEPFALAVDRRLPRRVQTFVSLYGSWLETLREPAHRSAVWTQGRRLVLLLGLDAALLASIVVGASLVHDPIEAWLARYVPVGPGLLTWLVPAAATVAGLPFAIGIVRCVHGLGLMLAREALPLARPGTADFADAPRRALLVMVQLLVMLTVLVPLLAVTQPFVPALSGAPVLVLLLLVAAFSFWRRTANLQQHIVAGAQMVVEALNMAPGHRGAQGAAASASQAGTAGHGRDAARAAGHGAQHVSPEVGALDLANAPPPSSMEDVERLLPGIGSLRRLRIAPDLACVGRSLRELDLRGLTGATVLAIARGEKQLVAPDGHEVLRAGDILALTGTHEAIDAAEALLGARTVPG